MLVTIRREGESIRIGDTIELTVLGINRTKVKIGINAPSSVRITRSETYQVEQENAAAGHLQADIATLIDRLQQNSAKTSRR